MTAPTWADAKSAHGPTVARFLDRYLGNTPASAYGEAFARRLYAWRHGENSCVFTLDRHLIELGLFLWELPDECWRHETAKVHHEPSEEAAA